MTDVTGRENVAELLREITALAPAALLALEDRGTEEAQAALHELTERVGELHGVLIDADERMAG